MHEGLQSQRSELPDSGAGARTPPSRHTGAMTSTQDETSIEDDLRQWARGNRPLEAATELLIRTGFAKKSWPWVCSVPPERPWIDFPAIAPTIMALSGGQQRILRIAASLAGAHQGNLGEDVAGLDYDYAALALAAIAHASGWAEPGRLLRPGADGTVQFVTVPALVTWPVEGAQA